VADHALILFGILNRALGPFGLGPLLGQDQAAFLVLRLEDQGPMPRALDV
jgi:hypothetical protein